MFEIAKENGRWDLGKPEDFVKASGLDRLRMDEARHATSPKRAWEMIDAGIKAAGMLQEGHKAAGFEGVRYRDGVVDRALDSDFSFNPFASRNPIDRFDYEKAKRGEYSRLVDLEGEVRAGAISMYEQVLLPEAARRLGSELSESEMAKTKPLHELSDVQFTRLFAEHARGMDAIKLDSRLIDVRDRGAEYQDTVVSSGLRKYLGTDGIESREEREGRITPGEAKEMLHIVRNIGWGGKFDAEPGIAHMASVMPNVGQPIRDYNAATVANGGYSDHRALNEVLRVAEADLQTWPERFGDLHRERLREGEERMKVEGLAYNPAGVPGANVPFGFSERKEANLFGRPQEGMPQPFEAAVKRGVSEMTSAFVNENGEKKISVAISSLLKSARGESQGAARSASKGVRIEERGVGLEAQAAAMTGARGR